MHIQGDESTEMMGEYTATRLDSEMIPKEMKNSFILKTELITYITLTGENDNVQ